MINPEEIYNSIEQEKNSFINIFRYLETFNDKPLIKYNKMRILRYLLSEEIIEMETNGQIDYIKSKNFNELFNIYLDYKLKIKKE